MSRGTIGIEKQSHSTLPIADYERMYSALGNACLVHGSDIVETFRAVKFAVRIDHIRSACLISSLAMDAPVLHCRAGDTEHAPGNLIGKALA